MAGDRARRRRTTGKAGAADGLLRGPALGRILFAAMAVVALIHVGWTLYEVRLAASMYGGAMPGMTREQARYVFGPPSAGTAPGAAVWRYRDGPAATSLRFAAEGAMVAVGCTSRTADGTACPGVLGVTLGTAEWDVTGLLGSPAREIYDADSKILDFPDLGLRFRMRRYLVTAIQLKRRSGRFSYVPRALAMLAP